MWQLVKCISEGFWDTTPQNITLHLKNIYNEGELSEISTCKDFLQVQNEGERTVQRSSKFYNLDAIISVGYRINSHRGTQFRIWATERLREYIIKGFTLDDDRLKEMGYKNDYFEELIERIRDIRTSEKNFYFKVRAASQVSRENKLPEFIYDTVLEECLEKSKNRKEEYDRFILDALGSQIERITELLRKAK